MCPAEHRLGTTLPGQVTGGQAQPKRRSGPVTGIRVPLLADVHVSDDDVRHGLSQIVPQLLEQCCGFVQVSSRRRVVKQPETHAPEIEQRPRLPLHVSDPARGGQASLCQGGPLLPPPAGSQGRVPRRVQVMIEHAPNGRAASVVAIGAPS